MVTVIASSRSTRKKNSTTAGRSNLAVSIYPIQVLLSLLTRALEDWAWKYKFSRDILYEVNDVNCSVGPVKHTKVLELDQKIRSFGIPSHLRIPPDGPNWERDGSMVTMQRFMIAMNRDASELFANYS